MHSLSALYWTTKVPKVSRIETPGHDRVREKYSL